jgi:hypothetical protein
MPTVAQVPAVEAQPLIAVRNVRASSRWYSELLSVSGSPEHPHRDFYDRLFSSGRMILQLHAWDEENHPNLVNRTAAPPRGAPVVHGRGFPCHRGAGSMPPMMISGIITATIDSRKRRQASARGIDSRRQG